MHLGGHAQLYLSSCGTQRLLAPILRPPATSASAASSLDLSLIHSSHSLEPQKGTRTSMPLFRFGLKSFHSSTSTRRSSRWASALAKRSAWMPSSSLRTSSTSVASLPVTLAAFWSAMCRRAMTNSPFLMSWGPSSMRSGTPFISQWLNFQPGVWSPSSRRTRTPASRSLSQQRPAASATARRSSSGQPALRPTGTTTTWWQATRGGSTRPLSSPWTMIMTPMVRCVMPQEFW
mmetsp:Transcript_93830/g.292423  ORF Transcript_93830/g.292423 Transcript_93830/m.292423 type:complete len:233 (-) Transcript_93830:1109-1807(-)